MMNCACGAPLPAESRITRTYCDTCLKARKRAGRREEKRRRRLGIQRHYHRHKPKIIDPMEWSESAALKAAARGQYLPSPQQITARANEVRDASLVAMMRKPTEIHHSFGGSPVAFFVRLAFKF